MHAFRCNALPPPEKPMAEMLEKEAFGLKDEQVVDFDVVFLDTMTEL